MRPGEAAGLMALGCLLVVAAAVVVGAYLIASRIAS